MPRSPPPLIDDGGHTANGIFLFINWVIFALGLSNFLYGLRYLSTFLQLLHVMPNTDAELHVLIAALLAAIDMGIAAVGVLAALVYSNRGMLVYAILLPLNGVAEAFMSWRFVTQTTGVLRGRLLAMMDLQWEHREHRMSFWDNTHVHFKCCGLNGPKDWAPTGSPLPRQCCNAHKLIETMCIETLSYPIGCAKRVSDHSSITTYMVVIFLCILAMKVFNLTLWWFVS